MRPTRTADDLIGKKVIVHEKHLLSQKQQMKRAWLGHRPCKIVGVDQNKDGALTHIYVVRGKKTRYDKKTGRFKTVKWLKTKKKIPAQYCTQTIRRIRREGNEKFLWEYPHYLTVTIRTSMAWEGRQAPLAWWLNNHDVLSFEKAKRMDLNKMRVLTHTTTSV